MQLDPREHFHTIVQPAIQAFELAGQALSDLAVRGADLDEQTSAERVALREGGAAALFLHHFADIVAARGGPGLADLQGKLAGTRGRLAEFCRAWGGTDEVSLLGDVADALKHAVLTHKLPREVEEAGQVLAIDRRYGAGRYGEGRYGGHSEVWILARAGPRTLSSVLTTVTNTWSRVLAGDRI